MSDGHTSIDELLDRAVAAINRGDRVTATELAEQVLAVDARNFDAEDLLAVPASDGEIRRLTILFADLVDSTALSTRAEPETYRLLVGRYRDLVIDAVGRLEGHIASTKGDGLLAVFGHPTPHEDDVRRAVMAGLEITRGLARLSDQAKRKFGLDVDVRVGIHRGLVYLDTEQDDVYGLAANLAARVSGLATPGTVVVSDSVAPLVQNAFELGARPAAPVKGIAEPVIYHQVLGERVGPAMESSGPLVGRDQELDELVAAWEKARAGELSVPGLVFRGEPGIGKSRLASAAADLAQDYGAVVQTYLLACIGDDAGLVVADDVHWFDSSTVEVLGSLMDTSEGRLLVVVTGRPGQWLPVSWPTTVRDLTPLTDEQADELISALDSNLSESERAAVRARCDGGPFYLEQVVGGMSDRNRAHPSSRENDRLS